MRCDKVRDILMDYVAEELPENTTKQVREHLTVCHRCRTELETARKASGMLTLLSHQEEPQGVIHVPAVTAKNGVPWQHRARLQLVVALLLALVICIVGANVQRSSKRTPPVAQVETPVHTGNTSPAPVVTHPDEKKSVAVHTETAPRLSVRAPGQHLRTRNKPHVEHNAPMGTRVADKLVSIKSEAQPVETIEEIPISTLRPVHELPQGAIMVVSVKWPSSDEVVDDSYSYRYTEYDPETGTTIESCGSRNGESVEIRIHGKTDEEQGKGEVAK